MSGLCAGGYGSGVVVRDATEDDIDAIAGILAAAWAWAFADILSPEVLAPRADPVRRAARIRENWPAHRRCLVGERNGRVEGFATQPPTVNLEGFDAEVQGLYVHPDAARHGAGGALLRTMVQRFVEDGARSMAIHTLAENRIGRGFYDKMGGQVVAEDTWNGISAVWYGWDEAGMRAIA